MSSTDVTPSDPWLVSLAAAHAWEPRIDAWAYLDDAAAERPAADGPLAGAPFAVKDVIDVAGMPTGYGWNAHKATPARADAAVVAALRAARARPIGKTRTTAFAFVDPTTTRNPYNPAHTPGGSSSGSGAVVGAGVAPFALGTQTAGSLLRPAAYCGAFAFKPSLGAWPTSGMCPLSRSFDAVGVIAHELDWLTRVYDVLAAAFGGRRTSAPSRPLRIGKAAVDAQSPDADAVRAMEDLAVRIAAAGHAVTTVCPPADMFPGLIAAHRTIMLAEAARDLASIIGDARDDLPPRLAAGLAEGRAIGAPDVATAQAEVLGMRQDFWDIHSGFDAILAYPASGAAPEGLTTTGDQSYQTPWTALGGPLVELPCGLAPNGLPVGVMLAAPPGADGALMNVAAAFAPLLPETPRPRMEPPVSPEG